MAQVVINVKPMNIVVYGCGGVGGYFGARLQDAGHKVHFIARGNHLSAILKNGLFHLFVVISFHVVLFSQ